MSSNKFKIPSIGTKYSEDNKIMHIGTVESINDEFDMCRVKVRVKKFDDHIENTMDLPFAFPLLQKIIHVIPKVGEQVWVIFPDLNNPHMDRLYMGPIISQYMRISGETNQLTSKSGLDSSLTSPTTAPSKIPEANGAYPKNNDIVINGRNNNDIVFKNNEIQIRVGKHSNTEEINNVPIFNTKNPTYIQLKNSKATDDGGVINAVASKINLLTHNGSPTFNLSDQNNMISNDELETILNNAHPLGYGDLIVEALSLLRDAIIHHVHPYNGTKAEDLNGNTTKKRLMEFDLNSIISQNIKIN